MELEGEDLLDGGVFVAADPPPAPPPLPIMIITIL